jgi:hypothetical protein
MVHRTCASTMGYFTCGTMLVHRCRSTSVIAQGAMALIRRVLHDLEVGFIINACAGA